MVALITFPFAILLLLLLLSRIQFGHGFIKNPGILAELTPVNPVTEAGDMLVLNCTLTPLYSGTYNASDIYFRYLGSVNYSYPYVQTLSNITAQLRLPNMTIDMRGKYRCWLPGIPLGRNAFQDLRVVRRPLKPVLNGCIISNWEQMECSWGPSRAEQVQHTNGHSFVQTFFYQHPGDGDNWKTCPRNDSEKCTWPASQFKMGANYCIQINATNALKHIIASIVTCVRAEDEIVKPDPPKNVESSFASEYDGHVMLHWNPPTSKYNYETPLIYHLNVQNQWQDQISNVTTTNTSMTLSVVPATTYTVHISVHPSRRGFASERVPTRFEIPATVPCKNPLTHTNAFFLVKDSRQVRLYWQPIAAIDSCGRGLSYEVRARQSDGATSSADIWSVVNSVSPSDNSAEVMLEREEDEVTILSKNSVGVAIRLPHVIIRVPSSSFVANVSLVVEGNNNTVMVHWFATAPVENVTGYTLFWCQQQSNSRMCKTPIQWRNLYGAELACNLTLSENYLHFQVGLAVNFRSGLTTGIMWADKLFSQTAKAEAPRIVDVVAPYLGSHGAIDIRWTPAPYTVHCAYVHTFVIFYCLADQRNSCQGEVQSVSIESWKNSTYSLANLEQGSTYRIWMTSVARTGSSKPSDPIYRTTTKSWATAGSVAGIVVAIIFVGAIAIGGLYVILRHLNKYRKNFVNGLNIPVSLPPTQRVQISSTSSDAPMLGTKFEFNQQLSVSSDDSGRCSLSPASHATSPLLPELTDANANLDSFMPTNYSALEDMTAEDDDQSTHGCVLSYTIVSNDVPKGRPASQAISILLSELTDENENLDSFMPTNIGAMEDMKAEDDHESTHGCVLSYTLMSNDAPKGEPVVPDGTAKMGHHTIPSTVSNGAIAGHSKHIFPEEIQLLGMLPGNPRCTESDVNYCTSLSFSHPSAGSTSDDYAADIAYAKVENLHQPTYALIDRLQTADAANERSQDSNVFQFNSSQDESPVEKSDLVDTIDQQLMNDLQIYNPTTSSESSEPELPPSPMYEDSDALFRGYTKNANIGYPGLACDDVEWRAGTPDFPQQLPLSNWGYVDHAVFGIDSIA